MREVNVTEGAGDSLLFTQPPITLLARRAGVYRMGGNVWKIMKDYIHYLLLKYLSSSVTILRHQGRQSINLKVLSESLSTCHNMNICVVPRKIRRTRKMDETGSNVDGYSTGEDDEEELDTDLVNEEDLDDDEVLDDEDVEDVEDVEDEVVEEVVSKKPSTKAKTKKAKAEKTVAPKRGRSRVQASK